MALTGGQELVLIERYLGCLNHTGTFLEIGARNGLTHSNTFFLEQARVLLIVLCAQAVNGVSSTLADSQTYQEL